ncbi:MAG TPA: RNA polymerase sigma factor [Candidatus Kapabacteria bacterium]|nr:RNA polymerase sigma factor [Candidatus Kapabacteria bacterium]
MARKFDEYSDKELCEMLSKKKEIAEGAFTELFNRYSQKVYAFCRRFMGDRDIALDIYQETFLRFHQSAIKNNKIDNIPGYLMKTARNLCLNAKRDERPSITFEEYMGGEDDSLENDKDELLSLIQKALELLPDDYKEVFILREYDGLPYSEIAVITDNTVANVKVKVHRAKQKIKEILQPYLSEL